jgi:hypothetical protein
MKEMKDLKRRLLLFTAALLLAAAGLGSEHASAIVPGESLQFLINQAPTDSKVLLGHTADTETDVSMGFYDNSGVDCDWLLHNPYSGEIQGMLLENGEVIDSVTLISGSADWVLESVSDLNGDGNLDIITHNTSSGALYAHLLDGLDLAAEGYILKGEEYQDWTIKGFGDFNADLKPDILFFNQESGVFTICLMDGLNIINSFNLGIQTESWCLAAVLDIDGDRMDDLIMCHIPSGAICAFRINGQTLSSTGNILYINLELNLEPYWTVVTAANIGGKPALILENPTTGHVRACWFEDNVFGQVVDIYTDSPAWSLESVGDFDGDGFDDLLARHENGWRYVITMDGLNIKGGYYLNMESERLNNWRVTKIADFNGDGVDDIAMFDQGAGEVRILFLDDSGLKGTQILYKNKPGWYYPSETRWSDMSANANSYHQFSARNANSLASSRNDDTQPPPPTLQSIAGNTPWTLRQEYAHTRMATSQSVDFFMDKNGVPRPIITTGMLGGRVNYHNLVIDRIYGLAQHGRWGTQHSPTFIEAGAGRHGGDNNTYVYGVVAGLTNGTVEEWLNSRNNPGVSPWATLNLETLNTERIPVMSMKCHLGPSGFEPKKLLACVVGTGTTKAPYKGSLYYYDIDLGWKLLEGLNEPCAFVSPGSFRDNYSPFFQRSALRDVVAVTKTLNHSKVIHWHDGEWRIIYDAPESITDLAVSRASSKDGLPKDIVISTSRNVIRFSCEGFGDYREEVIGGTVNNIVKMDVDFDPNGKLRSYILAQEKGTISISINGTEKVAKIGDGFSCSSLWSQFNSDGTLRAAVVGHINGEVLCWSAKHERFFRLHPPNPWIPEAFFIYDMNVEAAVNVHGHIDENNVLRVVATWNKYATAPGWVGEAASWLMGTATSYAGPFGLFVDIPLLAIACLDYDYYAYMQYKETTIQLEK